MLPLMLAFGPTNISVFTIILSVLKENTSQSHEPIHKMFPLHKIFASNACFCEHLDPQTFLFLR